MNPGGPRRGSSRWSNRRRVLQVLEAGNRPGDSDLSSESSDEGEPKRPRVERKSTSLHGILFDSTTNEGNPDYN